MGHRRESKPGGIVAVHKGIADAATIQPSLRFVPISWKSSTSHSCLILCGKLIPPRSYRGIYLRPAVHQVNKWKTTIHLSRTHLNFLKNHTSWRFDPQKSTVDTLETFSEYVLEDSDQPQHLYPRSKTFIVCFKNRSQGRLSVTLREHYCI